MLHVEPTGFWKNHTHFHGRRPLRGVTLGKNRQYEVFINALFPLAILWARLFADRRLEEDTMRMFQIIPASRSRVVKNMERDLIKGRFPVNTAEIEQGLLECYKWYCRPGRCGECEVGKGIEVKNEERRVKRE
jgi:hypothetical protein